MSDEYLPKHLRFLKEPRDIKYFFIGKDGQTYPDSASLAKADAKRHDRNSRPIPKVPHIYDFPPKLMPGDKLGFDKTGGPATSGTIMFGKIPTLSELYDRYRANTEFDSLFLKILKKATPPAVVMEQDPLTGILQPHRAAKDPEFQAAVQTALEDWEKRQKPDQAYKPSDEPVVLPEPKLKF